MRAIYSIESISSSRGSIFWKILESFSWVVLVLFIAMTAIFCVKSAEYDYFQSSSTIVRSFAFYLGIFSLLCVLCLAWMAYLALAPLGYLIHWARNAKNLQKITLTDENSPEISEVSRVINELLERLKVAQHSLIVAEKKAAMVQISAQVAHDIRSPLAAMSVIEEDLFQLPEETRLLLRSAIDRIRDIANNLVEQNQFTLDRGTQLSNELISILIDIIVTEKRIQYRSLNIKINWELSSERYGLFSQIQTVEFKRVLSNLIDNSVEAIATSGTVEVVLRATSSAIQIQCIDNGLGISPELLKKLGHPGETYGKTGGTGLGLYHAKSSLERWGGDLHLTSEVGKGTRVTLSLPRVAEPAWFAPELRLTSNSRVCILDDDISVHQVWSRRFSKHRPSFRKIADIKHFSAPKEFLEYVNHTLDLELNRNNEVSEIYLIDYELRGFEETGLDLIERLPISPHRFLVTNRFEEPNIRKRCAMLGVKIIPKGMAAYIPISVTV